MNKKILMSLFLVLLIAISVSAVSAEEATDVIAADDDAVDEIAVDSDVDEVAESATITPTSNDAAGIEKAITCSTAGDTIDLSAYDEYDVENNTIEIGVANLVLKGNGNTVIKGWGGPGTGIFSVAATGVTFQGIKFIDTNPNSVLTYYNDSTDDANEVKGWGIYFFQNKASNGVVDGCSFENFNHGVRIQGGAENVVVKNSNFTGVTNYLLNDPTKNQEKGTKAIGVMGSKGAQIINNTFEGPVLDAVSIASSSSGCSVINNTFIGNSYAIYFGGAATPGSVIKGNKFKNVGHYEGLDNNGNTVVWDRLPMISLEKSASDLTIEGNTFEVINNNIIIAAEAGNAAHGYPSEIGGIKVIDNTITAYDSDVSVSSAVLMHVLSRGGELNPTDTINVSGNTLNGATPLIYWNIAWGNEYGNAVVPAGGKAATYFKITSITPTALTGVLIDLNGNGVYKNTTVRIGKQAQTVISGESFVYNINGVNETGETDEDGVFTVPNPTGTIILYFLGTEKLDATELTVNYTAPAASPVATVLASSDLKIKAGDAGVLKATLKDVNGNALVNKTVSVIIDGETAFLGETDSNGAISVSLKYASAATKYASLAYVDQDGTHLSSLEYVKITVVKKATALSASKATLKVKKAKKVKVTLKSEGKALANKKVTIKVKGKTFSGKTNSKGVATISVKVAKKGKFTATVNFAGDGAYSAAKAVKVKFTVKK